MNDGHLSQSASPYPPATRSNTPYSMHSGSTSDHSLPGSATLHYSRPTTPYSHHGSLPASGSDHSLPSSLAHSLRSDLNFHTHNMSFDGILSDRWPRSSAQSSSNMSSSDEVRERNHILEADNLVLHTENSTLK